MTGNPNAFEVIAHIAKAADQFSFQAGVGSMETAGSIVSYLARHPEAVDAFMETGSIMDSPMSWHQEGLLSWHGMDGKIHHPKSETQQ